MRISTAEIKMLIKECVRQGGMYTAPDFKEYIVANSGKDVTRGQISGAVSQLVDTKEIVRVGRGSGLRQLPLHKTSCKIAGSRLNSGFFIAKTCQFFEKYLLYVLCGVVLYGIILV